ncbi:hypothetical protein [Brucella sp. BO2]|uniref:hypothetical protein n=1 Tax=Brucella sp. BO2 TaxID=693750 RepID=UPI0002DF68C7|nr:hypothetical protein [Brucella sp. BO2]
MASEINWHVRHDDEIWEDADGIGKWIANCSSAEIAKQIVGAINTRTAPVDANSLASNPVDDKIASDTDANAPGMAIEDLLKKAIAAFDALSPEQRAEMMEEQRRSWVRGNVGMSQDERGMTSPMMPQPAPAATDTGLVTVAWQRHSSFYADGWGPVDAGHAQKLAAAGEPVRELVTRSQAEELLAEERAKADEYYGEAVASYDRKLRIEALEAKLAAVEKALEPFAAVLDDYDPEDEDDFTPGTLVIGSATNYDITLGDLRKARAALGVKTS